MVHTITVPTFDAADTFIACETNQSYFTYAQLHTPIDELIIDMFMDIQFNVESDSYIKHLDYTMMEDDEISDIVANYSDLI
jgi:hypothetical protein